MVTFMGSFELAAMHCVLRLRDHAYGRRIHDSIEAKLNKSVPMGQVYVALARLEQKGFLRSELGEATAVRGGRAKRIYEITGEGARALTAEHKRFSVIFDLPMPSRRA